MKYLGLILLSLCCCKVSMKEKSIEKEDECVNHLPDNQTHFSRQCQDLAQLVIIDHVAVCQCPGNKPVRIIKE